MALMPIPNESTGLKLVKGLWKKQTRSDYAIYFKNGFPAYGFKIIYKPTITVENENRTIEKSL